MKKLIAFTLLCFFSLLLKNEKAICKSNCQVSFKTIIQHPLNNNMDSDGIDDELKQYDGFFFKI
ncbi:MAG: hypothetical protein JWO92_1378 [Chitinophagaceae bacterium]|nr:hypothetical protein [Chitinophagaceae bacterium]MDB5223166.1 hypothetical protein [Chitinophagaceae bacterium]